MDGKPDMNGDFVRRWTLVCVCSKFVIFLGEEWGVADHRKPTDLL